MDFYMAPAGNTSRTSLPSYYDSSSAANKGTSGNKVTSASRGTSASKTSSHFRQQQNKQDKQQHSVTFQVYHEDEEAANSDDQINTGSMERELKASIARLYQNYDFVTDEYDRLFDIVDSVREDYNNTKSLFLYHRYHEFKRLIKNAIRKWRAVEKRNSLAVSRKQSNASFALAIQTGSLNRGLNPGLPGIPEENSNSYSGNLNARLRANKDESTKELYDECTRLEREIFQYKSRNQQIKNLLCKLAGDYDSAKEHAMHIWGRYKELKQMIMDVINADV